MFGRPVIEFDEDDNIIPGSYDETVSGVFATDALSVAEATVNADAATNPLEESQEVSTVPDTAATGTVSGAAFIAVAAKRDRRPLAPQRPNPSG